MRFTTLICALAAALQLVTGTALAGSGGWTWPVRGPVLTAYRNGGDPYAAGQHRGIDIGAPVGARVVAATAGTITFAGLVGTSGLTISERTADGSFDLSYLHLSSVAVRRGDRVAAGAALGGVGVSGQRSVDQPHLHFGVREAGTRSAYRDPLDLLAPPPAGRAPEPGPAPVRVTEPSAADTAPGASAAAPSPAPASPPGLPARSPLPSPAAGPGPRPVPAHNPAMPVQVTIPTLHAPRAWHAYSTAPSARGHATGPAPHASGGAGSVRASWSTPSGAAAPDPARGPGTARAATASRVLHPSQARRGRGGGIDIAWLLACLGLVATAAVLGRHGGRPRAARGRRSVVAALLGLTARGSGAR